MSRVSRIAWMLAVIAALFCPVARGALKFHFRARTNQPNTRAPTEIHVFHLQDKRLLVAPDKLTVDWFKAVTTIPDQAWWPSKSSPPQAALQVHVLDPRVLTSSKWSKRPSLDILVSKR